MAAITSDVKAFIVQALACFDTPSTVVALVKKEFGVSVTIQQVSLYDPTKAAGKALSRKWVDLFNSTRQSCKAKLSEIPISNKAYRLRVLDRMAADAENAKNYPLAAKILEQAAKECGDSYTNKQKHEHSGAGGGPIETLTLSKDEYKQARREMLEGDNS
ncbi:DUF2280 domain-containing protein [Vibrio fluvialis]